MPYFRSILFASVLVGLIVGSAITVVQFFGTIQLITQAEVFEKAGDAAHHHSQGEITGSPAEAHQHGESGWEPRDGLERLSFTLAANILTSIGYSLVLVGLISLRGETVTWREGLVWGLAAFASVMLAPMLGLPPELPGTPSAPLAARQIWWVGTALATAAGIALIAFNRAGWMLVPAVALIAAPHVIGAPSAPVGEHGLAPAELEQRFIAAAVVTSFVFWVMLGSLGAAIHHRLRPTA